MQTIHACRVPREPADHTPCGAIVSASKCLTTEHASGRPDVTSVTNTIRSPPHDANRLLSWRKRHIMEQGTTQRQSSLLYLCNLDIQDLIAMHTFVLLNLHAAMWIP